MVICTISFSGFGTADSTANEEEISLYALIPTGEDMLSKGEATKAALEIASEDMNTLYEKTGSKKRVVVNTPHSPDLFSGVEFFILRSKQM